MPGSFYINYSIHLYNPISNPLSFKTDKSVLLRDFDLKQQNISCVLMEENNKYGPGTLINVEKLTGTYRFMYNGTEIQLDPNGYATFFYSSIPTLVDPEYDTLDLTNFTYASITTAVHLTPDNELLIINPDTQFWLFYRNNGGDPLRVDVDPEFYYIEDANALSSFQGAAVEINSVSQDQRPFQYISGVFRNCYFQSRHEDNKINNNFNKKTLQGKQIKEHDKNVIKDLKQEFEKLSVSETKSQIMSNI